MNTNGITEFLTRFTFTSELNVNGALRGDLDLTGEPLTGDDDSLCFVLLFRVLDRVGLFGNLSKFADGALVSGERYGNIR